jgi:hypothetical protein
VDEEVDEDDCGGADDGGGLGGEVGCCCGGIGVGLGPPVDAGVMIELRKGLLRDWVVVVIDEEFNSNLKCWH